jgi:(2Fe-2S) ferredoxin
MSKFERHVFVCENRRDPGNPKGCCASKGSGEVLQAFKKLMAEAGLRGRMRANGSGCLDACEQGPAVVVYPEAVWYRVPTAEDAAEIVREHLVGGRVVDRLRMNLAPRP